MKLPRPFGVRGGFTFIEFTIVLAILAFTAGLGLFVSLEFYRGSVLDSERDQFLSILRRARNAAINNIHNLSHGVYVASSSYIIFAGPSYVGRIASYDEIFPRAAPVSFSGPSEIVFSRLAATSSASGTIILSYVPASTTIQINYEGQISW